jgi:3-(3-hydroxy-phenyl)propionate hydroxylase
MVIVGLGPVGAVAANLAGAAGFKVLVIDRDPEPFTLPRAIVFDAEIMRVFASIGLADEISAVTRPLGGSVYLGADRRPIRTFRSPGAAHAQAWAPSNLFYQPTLETAIRKGLERFPNLTVRTGCEVTDLVASGLGARLTIDDGQGGFEVDARFVLACDGASSTMRKRLDVGLDDIGFEERWLVVDAHVRGAMHWPETYGIPPEVRDGRYSLMVCDPEQPATIIPGVGAHRRWEYMLMPGESDEAAVRPDRIVERLAQWADPTEIEIIRSAVYRFRALVAHRWRIGSVFLLGDAAHQTPPFFGQGMCHGIRDAAQLMWRLRMVRDGAASADLLHSYQTEREPHVREIITASVTAGAAVCITDRDLARARDAEFRAAEAARAGAPVAMTDVVPPIRAGLIDAATGGERLPEFGVERDGDVARLDTRLGTDFVVLSADRLGDLATSLGDARRWAAISAAPVRLARPGSPARDHDVDGRFAAWLAEHSAYAVVVRPDRYVYGVAASAADLRRLIGQLLEDIAGQTEVRPKVETALP